MDGDPVTSVALGWMWFDDDPKTSLEDKVCQASKRYREKFGQRPRLCYVSRSALAEPFPVIDALQMRAAGNVFPGHFLFVVEADGAERQAA